MAISRANTGKQVTRPGKVKTVMHEFKAGTLKSSSGQRVTNPKQAVAIALSEARRQRGNRRPKRMK